MAASDTPDIRMTRNADGFTKSIYRFFDNMARHSRAFIVLLAVGFVIAAVIGFTLNQREMRSGEAKNALFNAQKASEKELKALALVMKPPAPDKKAAAEEADEVDGAKPTDAAAKAKKAAPKPPEGNPSDIEFAKFDVDGKLPESVKAFTGVADKFSGSRIGTDAQLALGQLYYQHGQPEKAAAWFQKAADGASGRLDRALAFAALGYSKESSGALPEATQLFEKALDLGEASLKGDLLMAIARCQEGMKDVAKARSTYERITKELPNTDYAKNADVYKGLLD